MREIKNGQKPEHRKMENVFPSKWEINSECKHFRDLRSNPIGVWQKALMHKFTHAISRYDLLMQ